LKLKQVGTPNAGTDGSRALDGSLLIKTMWRISRRGRSLCHSKLPQNTNWPIVMGKKMQYWNKTTAAEIACSDCLPTFNYGWTVLRKNAAVFSNAEHLLLIQYAIFIHCDFEIKSTILITDKCRRKMKSQRHTKQHCYNVFNHWTFDKPRSSVWLWTIHTCISY